MAEPVNYHDVPVELVFDVARGSPQMKLLGLSQMPDGTHGDQTAQFEWACQTCGAMNQDTVMLKPQQAFFARWTCPKCARMTLVRFRARSMAEWASPHTGAATDEAAAALAWDNRSAAGGASRVRRPARGRLNAFTWLTVAAVVVIVGLTVLDMRRVSNTSASNSRSPGIGQTLSSTPSSRIVGYWINAARDHVVCFGPIDPVTREGSYSTVYRGGRQPETVRFRIIDEEPAGEHLVIRRERAGDRLVVKEQGSEITYRVQSDAAEVTLDVAMDGKSMTRLDIRDGEPVMTTYTNAGDSDPR